MHAEIRRVNECWGEPREWEKAQRKRVAVVWCQTCTFRLKIKLVSSFRHESLGSPLFYSRSLASFSRHFAIFDIVFACAFIYFVIVFFYVATSFHSISFPHDALPFQRFFVEREYLKKKTNDKYVFNLCVHAFLAHY